MNNNKFTDGFMLGALVGGAAVFLLGTKRGNKILKVLTEEGLEGLSVLVENLEDKHNGVTPKPAEIKVKKEKELVIAEDEEAPEEVEEKIELVAPTSNGYSNGHSKRFFKRK